MSLSVRIYDFLFDVFIGWELCLLPGHLPTSLSLSRAFVLSRTQRGHLSNRKVIMGNTCDVRFIVCQRRTAEHVESLAQAVMKMATSEGDACLEAIRRWSAALPPEMVNLSCAGRATAMTRTANPLAGLGARPAVVVSARGARYDELLASGLAAMLRNIVAMLHTGALRAGRDFKACGQVPNRDVIVSGLRKRLSASDADKRATKVANISGLLFLGATASALESVCYFGLLFGSSSTAVRESCD